MSASSQTQLKLKMLSDPANLAGVRQAVERLCADNGVSKQACDDIGLCVNEALANVIRHAYGGATDKPIEIFAQTSEDQVRIGIRDWGNGAVPAEMPMHKPDPMTPGGLGMICLGRMMDQVTFSPQPDGGILLEMIRKK
jgi:anti-sigma regulatory factor (Ser/Thr protein kinase)